MKSNNKTHISGILRKLAIISFFTLLSTALCMGDSVSSFIRHNQWGTYTDVGVGPTGSGTISSPWAIHESSTFQLYALRQTPSEWHIVGQVWVDPYSPTGNVSIWTDDTWNRNRTRSDIPYQIDLNVTMPAPFPGSEQGDLYLALYWQSYDSLGNLISQQGPWWHGTTSTSWTGLYPQTSYGTEYWFYDSWPVNGAGGERVSTASVSVFPTASASVSNFPSGEWTDDPFTLPDAMVDLLNLYPANTALARLVRPDGSTVDFGTQSDEGSLPVNRSVTVDIVNHLAGNGTYSLEIWTWTPIAGWELVPVGSGSTTFTLNPSFIVNTNLITGA